MARSVIDTKTVREQLGGLLDRAQYRGEEFVIQRRGRPLAALVPYDAYERFRTQRQQALKVFEEIGKGNADLDPQQAAEDADQAVAEVRRLRNRSGGRPRA